MLITTRTSRLLAASALLLAAPALAGCSTERPTDKIYTPAVGANDRSERVDVLNAVVVSNEGKPGEGTLVVTLVNNEVVPAASGENLDDKLTGVLVKGGEADFGKPVTIGAGRLVVLATPSEAIPTPAQPIPVTGDFDLGDYVTITFQFANSGDVKVEAPVVQNVQGYQFECQNGDTDEAPAQIGPDSHGEGHGEEHGTEHGEEHAAEGPCPVVGAGDDVVELSEGTEDHAEELSSDEAGH